MPTSISGAIGTIEIAGRKSPIFDIEIHPAVQAARDRRKKSVRKHSQKVLATLKVAGNAQAKARTKLAKKNKELAITNQYLKLQRDVAITIVAALSVALITLLAQ